MRLSFVPLLFLFAGQLGGQLSYAGPTNPTRGAQAQPAADLSLFLPHFESDQEKLRFLIWAKEHVPTLFSEAAVYHIDLFGLVGDQSAIIQALKNEPGYVESIQARRDLLSLQVGPQAKAQETVRTIGAEGTERLKTAFERVAADLPGRMPALEEIASRINARAEQLGNRSSANLLTGLISMLPGPLKAQAFKARTLEEKLILLGEHLPDPIPAGFNGELHGIHGVPAKAEALRVLQELATTEQSLSSEAALYTVLNRSGPSSVAGGAALRARIGSLRPKDFQVLLEKEAQETFQKPQIVNRLRDYAKNLSGPATRTIAGSGKTIRLQEVPPALGIFRGCAGGDCSTSRSFPYPNDPNERVFFVLDDAGQIKGYVNGTVVNAAGKRSFYLHTLTGWRVGAEDSRMILQALFSEKTRLGVEQVVLPENRVMERNVNYMPIRELYRGYTEGRPSVALSYLNPGVRTRIDEFHSSNNNGSYDQMSENKIGVVVDQAMLSAGGEAPLQTKVEAIRYPGFEGRPVSRSAVLELALDMRYGKPGEDFKRALSAGGLQPDELEPLIKALQNNEALPIAEYEQKARHHAASLGLPEDFFRRKRYLLSAGRYLAPDAMAVDHRAQTIKDLMDDFKSSMRTPEPRKFFTLHAREIGKEPLFLKTFSGLLREGVDGDELYQVFSLIETIPDLKDELAPSVLRHAMDDFYPVRGSAENLLRQMKPRSEAFFKRLDELAQSKDSQIRTRALALQNQYPRAPRLQAKRLTQEKIAALRQEKLLRAHAPRFAGDRVNLDRMMRDLEIMTGERPIEGDRTLSNRYTTQNKELLRGHLIRQLRELGYDVRVEEFRTRVKNIPGTETMKGANIIAEKRGWRTPNEIVEVVAHYDSQGPLIVGADDNASGVASTLEMARSSRDFESERTVRFVFTDFEEVNMEGSTHHVKQLQRHPEQKLVGAFVVDMIGYSTDSGIPKIDLEIGAQPRNQAFANQLLFQAEKYTDRNSRFFPVTIGAMPDTGDHGAYWKKGFPAVFVSQSFENANPAYQLPSDTIDTINRGYFREITQRVQEGLARVAGFSPRAGIRPQLEARIGEYERLTNAAADPARDYVTHSAPVRNQVARRARAKAEALINPILQWYEDREVARNAGLLNPEELAIQVAVKSDVDAIQKAAAALDERSTTQQIEELTSKLSRLLENTARRWDLAVPDADRTQVVNFCQSLYRILPVAKAVRSAPPP